MKPIEDLFNKFKDYEQIGLLLLKQMNAQDAANAVLSVKLQEPRTNKQQIIFDQVITYLLNQQ